MVEAIQALRGVELTGAVILLTERGDLMRFENPRQLMSYLGLTPSEYSSGERRRQGGITKAGNSHARRALVEGAWAYRSPAKVSRPLQLRLETLPAEVQAISWKAQVRLCKRYRQLTARGKHVTLCQFSESFRQRFFRIIPPLAGAALLCVYGITVPCARGWRGSWQTREGLRASRSRDLVSTHTGISPLNEPRGRVGGWRSGHARRGGSARP